MSTTHSNPIYTLSQGRYHHPSRDALTHIRRRLMAASQQTLNSQAPWLIGSDGCHLCTQAQADYDMIRLRLALPDVQHLELMDFDDDIIDALGTYIPVFVTQHTLLAYPFGIMDLIAAIKT